MAHASRHYKARWLRAFTPASGVLRCVGAIDGAPWAVRAQGAGQSEGGDWEGGWDWEVDGGWGGGAREVGAALDLERLHLDHERPLHATCTGGARRTGDGPAKLFIRTTTHGTV